MLILHRADRDVCFAGEKIVRAVRRGRNLFENKMAVERFLFFKSAIDVCSVDRVSQTCAEHSDVEINNTNGRREGREGEGGVS